MILRNNAPLHVYSILHVYKYCYVQILVNFFPSYSVLFGNGLVVFWECFLEYFGCALKIFLLFPLGVVCQCFGIKTSPLHDLILVCTFIDFEKIFPPTHLFCFARLMFSRIFPHLFGTLEQLHTKYCTCAIYALACIFSTQICKNQ